MNWETILKIKDTREETSTRDKHMKLVNEWWFKVRGKKISPDEAARELKRMEVPTSLKEYIIEELPRFNDYRMAYKKVAVERMADESWIKEREKLRSAELGKPSPEMKLMRADWFSREHNRMAPDVKAVKERMMVKDFEKMDKSRTKQEYMDALTSLVDGIQVMKHEWRNKETRQWIIERLKEYGFFPEGVDTVGMY